MNAIKFTFHETAVFLENIIKSNDNTMVVELDSKKHSLIGYRESEKIFHLKLPLPMPSIIDDENLTNYFDRINYPGDSYTIVLIQAGYCALGYYENGELMRHKAMRSYMTRKKQGKNELTYINNKGKSNSAGSKLRYQNAIKFFEEINEKLNEWDKIIKPKRIFYSCPVKMWNFIFESKVKCCFDKMDKRLQKIPLDVNVPNFEELIRVNRYVTFGYLDIINQKSNITLSLLQ